MPFSGQYASPVSTMVTAEQQQQVQRQPASEHKEDIAAGPPVRLR
jgi:hypothetical protein